MSCTNIPILIPENDVQAIVWDIARRIVLDARRYHYREFNFVTVLEGARRFSRDLRLNVAKQIGGVIKINNYEIKLASYEGTEGREIRIEKDINENIEEKHLIIVEDIVDRGKTLEFLINHLFQSKMAGSLKVAALLSKSSRRQVKIPVGYLGREIEEVFVVGYGMDKDSMYRELDYIGVWEEK